MIKLHQRKLNRAQLFELYASAAPTNWFAERWGVDPNVIRRARTGETYQDVLEEYMALHGEPVESATALSDKRLSDEAVWSILNSPDEKLAVLALIHGVSEGTVADIRHGRSHRRLYEKYHQVAKAAA